MSSDAALLQLAQSLKIDATELRGLDNLTPTQIRTLEAMVQSARANQRQTMSDAIDRGLDHIPALLRGAVKKIVRG